MAKLRPEKGKNNFQRIPELIDEVRKSGEENTTLTEYLDELSTQYVPDTYLSSRAARFELAKIQRNLFTDIEERESGNFIIYGTNGEFSPIDFIAFRRGITQILYNQSFQMGNEDIYSGLKREEAKNVSQLINSSAYAPVIAFSLNELCRAGYGEVTPQQRKKLSAIIKALRGRDFPVMYSNGDIAELAIMSQLVRYIRKKDGAIFYILQLNPIWNDMAKGWEAIPQDYTQRMAALPLKRTESLELLSDLLLYANKKQPLYKPIGSLIEDLRLTNAYNKDAKRTETQLLTYFEAMKTIGLIKEYDVQKGKIKRRIGIVKVIFYFNPDFKKIREGRE